MITEKIKIFLALPCHSKLLLLEAFLFQLIAGLLLKAVPFRLIPRFFANPSRLRPDRSILLLGEIKTATQNASRISPWKNKCLVQSLAARWMLRRRKIRSQLSFGVTSGIDKKILAHAWLAAGDFELVEKEGDYRQLYMF